MSCSCECKLQNFKYGKPFCTCSLIVEQYDGDPEDNSPSSVQYGDILRFWSEGSIFLNLTPGSANLQIEADNILSGLTPPSVPPPGEDRPALYIDFTDGSLFAWTGITWIPTSYAGGGTGAISPFVERGPVIIQNVDIGSQLGDDFLVGATGSTGQGTRFMYYALKGALRSGTVTGSQWDHGSVGINSFASGLDNTASGDNSHAEGAQNIASGVRSHAEGVNSTASGGSSHAEGISTLSSGLASHSEGFSTRSTGSGSHSEGISTLASGNGSHSEGQFSIASGIASHSEGFNNFSGSTGSHAEGILNFITGQGSHGEGLGNTCIGQASHVEGNANVILGDYAHGEGQGNTGSGLYSHVEGVIGVASGTAAHCEGQGGRATGNFSHSEGFATVASGGVSHAEGQQTTASGGDSHAEGFNTLASGLVSHAEGDRTIASGANSHSEGSNTIANSANSHVGGEDSITENQNDFAHGERVSTQQGSTFIDFVGSKTIFGRFGGISASFTKRFAGSAVPQAGFFIANGTDASNPAIGFSVTLVNSAGGATGGSAGSPNSLRSMTVRAAEFIANGSGAFVGGNGQADYAELFEFSDPLQNVLGRFVTFSSEPPKIKWATEGDQVLGVVSSTPTTIGGAYERWPKMFQLDGFDKPIMEYSPLAGYIHTIGQRSLDIKESWPLLERIGDLTKYTRLFEENYESVKAIYTDIISNSSLTSGQKSYLLDEAGIKPIWREKYNKEWNPDLPYIPRQARKEWGVIGLLGQICVEDDGSCVVGGFCKSGMDGKATSSTIGWRVIGRTGPTTVKIFFK